MTSVMNMKTISERLKEALKIRHMKAAELSRITGVDRGSISNYISGRYEPKQKAIYLMARALNINEAWLMGYDVDMFRAPDKTDEPASGIHGTVPVIDGIAAGLPVLADENIVDYMLVTVPNASEYFALVVHGESMIGAGIPNGSKVLIHIQHDAEDGQIVACRLNGEEATLKRFKQKGDTVFLLPENPAFEPYIVPVSDFTNGDAEILGVVKQVIIDL